MRRRTDDDLFPTWGLVVVAMVFSVIFWLSIIAGIAVAVRWVLS